MSSEPTRPGAWGRRWWGQCVGWVLRDSSPWMIGAGVLLAIAVITSAWGNFPLNDDWQYARAAQILAATNSIVIDTPIAPSLIGQLFLAWPFLKVFGFNHLLLRLLTMTVAGLLLWALDRILDHAQISRATRIKALVLVALNPWFSNLALSFMTECHGYALALAGAVIWLAARRTNDGRQSPAAVSLWAALLAGALTGASFWIRQFCVVVYPALILATLYRLVIDRSWGRLWSSLWRMAAGVAVFGGVIAAYFAWARHAQTLKTPFSGPLGQMFHFSLVDYQIVIGLQLFYIGGALFPLLATWPLRGRSWGRTLVAGAVACGFGLGAYSLLNLAAPDLAGSVNLHRAFPYASNIINTHGIGPNTLTDMFFHNPDHYFVLSRKFWQVVGLLLLVATALWGLPFSGPGVIRSMTRSAQEILVFATAFTVASLVMVVQSSGQVGFDRYYFPILLGTALGLAVLLHGEETLVARLGRRRPGPLPFVLLSLPLALFTIGGMHDYFRWNESRWRLVEHARAKGIPSTSIDGGYEVNGALSFDLMRKNPEKIDTSKCIGACRCTVPWNLGHIWTCYDDSYRVGMSLRDGYVEIARDVPRFWLGRNRPLILSRRPQ